MSRRSAPVQDETTPLLTHHSSGDGEGRWSLARRRSSAFLSFLSEPEDKDGDEFHTYHRKRTIYLIVFLNTVYYIGIGCMNAYLTEFIQTLVCAEYYYTSQSQETPFPTLPTTGDPIDVCSVPWVEKRSSQISTYTDVLMSVTSCFASLLLAKGLLPRFKRRSLVIGAVAATTIQVVSLALIPTHYSFDSTVPSSSTMHPTTALYLLVWSFVVAGLFGAPQTAAPLLGSVMILDVVHEEEKTAGLAQMYSSVTLGIGIASPLIKFIFPYFGLRFSILRHLGPFSPYWLVTGVFVFDLVLVILFLPETKPIAQATIRSRANSFSSEDSLADLHEPLSEPSPPQTPGPSFWEGMKGSIALFGYFLPYQPVPGGKRDYKLPLILCAVVFSDTITMAWSNLVVFCSIHLRFGPEEVTTLFGILGLGKGLFTLMVIPPTVTAVRRMVKKRMREEIVSAPAEELTSEIRILKREQSVIFTDKLVAIISLLFDFSGFIFMGIAATQLSAAGIYASTAFLMFAAGALPAIQALSIDLFLAQDRPTDDPVAARDAFVGFLNLVQTVLTAVGPLLNNFIYEWSVDHGIPSLVFFWTSLQSVISVCFITATGFFS